MRQRERGLCELEARLVYMSSRLTKLQSLHRETLPQKTDTHTHTYMERGGGQLAREIKTSIFLCPVVYLQF